MSTIRTINKVVSTNYSTTTTSTSFVTIATTAELKSRGRPIVFGIQRSSTGAPDTFSVASSASNNVAQLTIQLVRNEVGGSSTTLLETTLGAIFPAVSSTALISNSISHYDFTAIEGKKYTYTLKAKVAGFNTGTLNGSVFAIEL